MLSQLGCRQADSAGVVAHLNGETGHFDLSISWVFDLGHHFLMQYLRVLKNPLEVLNGPGGDTSLV